MPDETTEATAPVEDAAAEKEAETKRQIEEAKAEPAEPKTKLFGNLTAFFSKDTFNAFQVFKEVIEATPELQQPHPRLEAAIDDMLVVAFNELDDTVDLAEELHDFVDDFMKDATEAEFIRSFVLFAIAARSTKALVTPEVGQAEK